MRDKINKLLALSKSSNIHEAELALSKAHKLMEEHQLSFSDLTPESVLDHTNLVEITGQHMIWAPTLASAAAMMFDCKVVRFPSDNAIRFFGEKENLEASQLLFWHLFNAWKTICNMDYKEDQPYNRKLYRKSHGMAFANAIYTRAYALTEKRKENIQKGTGKDLVVVAINKVDEYIKSTFETCESKTREVKISHSGSDKGSKAGNNIVLNSPLTQETRLLK